ncbi:DUF3857 domain-containing protein [Gelidibacter mesophilus]|uniref:DUF3857 domain-containing protein n=1 Tax=Gelidibacter mesophilus TaxID=169050 RepID=UPI0004026556|nr:DUF3857 domain-containing protein [Gelidibacter mesophilus]
MKKSIYLFVFIAFNWANAQDFRYGKVSMDELQEMTYSEDSEANAAILYLNQKVYYDFIQNEGFVKIVEVFKRIKIYNNDGFEWATEAVQLRDNEKKTETISALRGVTYTLENGKILEAKLKKDGIFDEKNNKHWKTSKFTMPNVKEGCVIEFEYKITSPYISIDDLNLQYNIPIKELDMNVRIPEYFNFNRYVNPRATYIPKIKDYLVSRAEVIQTKERTGGGLNSARGAVVRTTNSNSNWEFKENKTEIKLSNVPALKDEDYVSNLNTYRTKLIWEYASYKDLRGLTTTYSTNWEELTRTIFKDADFGTQLKLTNYFEEDVAALLKGVTTDSDKINLIYNFVKSKVKWNDYYGYTTDNGVKKAYKEGVGNVADINLMLTSMLRYAKIKADPMLISTCSNDIPLFPGTGAFNYVVAAVQVRNDVMILDATDKFATSNVLPIAAINWQGRIIMEDGSSSWQDLSPKDVVREMFTVSATINGDLTVEGKVRTQLTSFAAKNFRSKYENYNAEEKLTDLEKDKGEIEVTNYEITDMNEVNKPIVYVYDYKLSRGIEQIGDELLLTPMLFLAPQENIFKQDKRAFPIDFVYAFSEKHAINMVVPEGYMVASLPENSILKFQENGGEFKYIAKANGKMLQFVISMDLNHSLILPDEYQDFKRFYQLMTEKQMEKVVLKKI